jgi:hypothetical protein
VRKKKNPHIGSNLDKFLKDDGVLEELQTLTIKEVVAWQLAEAMGARCVQIGDGETAAHQPNADRSPA